MKTGQKKLENIGKQIDTIIKTAEELEKRYGPEIDKVHPLYRKSALNLIHYLALRCFDLDKLQEKISDSGLPGISHAEGHVMKTLLDIKSIVSCLRGVPLKTRRKGIISVKKGAKLLSRNTALLLGKKPGKRKTRIMVTLPVSAASDYQMISSLLQSGMNCARINCAHDDQMIWEKIIQNTRKASEKLNRDCTILMDIAGSKLRTGPIKSGPRVIHIKPQRNSLGIVTAPARIWIAPQGVNPPDSTADFVIPVDDLFLKKIRRGSILFYTDSRGKKGNIFITKKQGEGKWGVCEDSAYLTTGTRLSINDDEAPASESGSVNELKPVEEFILLNVGDTLILHADPSPGEAAVFDSKGELVSPAHISCTFSGIFSYAKPGEPIYFDDGKIEGIIEEADAEKMIVRIVTARASGSRLRADKGINLPRTELSFSGFTEKDRKDISFVMENADVINLSFVNEAKDINELLEELKTYNREIGIILKIETQKGFKNLPELLLCAMQTHPVGIMIARGDLAIETGWKNFATIQEEIMRICEAAHLPVVWATQVLDNLAKNGIPTRAEITDAAMAQRCECVMLNKGKYIDRAVKMLDRILRRMEKFQNKKETILPRLDGADELRLSHEKYDI